MNLSLRFLGGDDSASIGSGCSFSLLFEVTTIGTDYDVNNQQQTFPLTLLNCGFGVLRNLPSHLHPHHFPSTIIFNGSSLLETAELIPLLSKITKQFYQIVVKRENTTLNESSSLIIGSATFGTKLTLVFSSEDVWKKIRSRLEFDLFNNNEDDVDLNETHSAIKNFLARNVQVVILMSESDEHEQEGENEEENSKLMMKVKSISRTPSFQISSFLQISSTFMNGLKFSLTNEISSSSLPLLSVAPRSASTYFSASQFLRQHTNHSDESSNCLFSLVPIQSEKYFQQLNEFCKTLQSVNEDENFHAAFDDAEKKSDENFTSRMILCVVPDVISTIFEKHQEIEIKNSVVLIPSLTRLNNANSIFSSEIHLFSTIPKQKPMIIPEEVSPAPVSPKKITKNSKNNKSSSSQQQQQRKPPATLLVGESQNTSSATIVPKKCQDDQQQIKPNRIPDTPDLSAIGGAALSVTDQQQPEKERESSKSKSPTKSEKKEGGNENNTNKNDKSDASVSSMLEEMGESPTFRMMKTPPRGKRINNGNDDDDGDDQEVEHQKMKNVRATSSSAKSTPNKNRTTSKNHHHHHHQNATDAFLIDFLLRNEQQNQSRREILQQQHSLLVDPPTRSGIAARVFAFSNEDKAKPGKMIMLRSVRTIEQLKQKVSEMFVELKPVGELMFAETGEPIKSVKDIKVPDQEIVAVMHGGLPYEVSDPPRLMKCYSLLVPQSDTSAKWVAMCRNL